MITKSQVAARALLKEVRERRYVKGLRDGQGVGFRVISGMLIVIILYKLFIDDLEATGVFTHCQGRPLTLPPRPILNLPAARSTRQDHRSRE